MSAANAGLGGPLVEDVEIMPRGLTTFRRVIDTDGSRVCRRWERDGWHRVPGDQWRIRTEIDARLGRAIDHTPAGEGYF